jgi:hypothetical protein
MRGVDPRIAEIVGAAAADLGYTIKATSGFRHGGGFHGRGMAEDFQLFDAAGNAIPNRGGDPTGMYSRLARQAFARQQSMYPELTGRFNWGGAHGTSRGSVNDIADLMHYDTGGERGHIARNRRQALEGRFGAPAPFQRLDVHIHDDGVRMKASGNAPIRANYRGKRMAEVGSGTQLGFGKNWWGGS